MKENEMKIRDWLTTFPLRWTRLAYALALFFVFKMLVDHLAPSIVPPEAFWIVIGVIVGAFANAMTAPDPSKSEVLELAEKVIDKLDKKEEFTT